MRDLFVGERSRLLGPPEKSGFNDTELCFLTFHAFRRLCYDMIAWRS